MIYNWQQNDWPNFSYDISEFDTLSLDFVQKAGYINGLLSALPNKSKEETLIEILVNEAIKTSEIEGEYISREDVMHSLKRNLGFIQDKSQVKDKRAIGVADLMTSVRKHFDKPLTNTMLFEWHEMIMMGSSGINSGMWRKHSEPMQVVSGSIGKEKVHFEAPPSSRVPIEMDQFIKWFNDTAPGAKNEIKHLALRSSIAHLYFESIHPFEDGNGRIGRAIAEKAISQGLKQPTLISLSRTIEAKRNLYYEALKSAQRSNHISNWINYFSQVIVDAQKETEVLIDFALKKTRFFEKFQSILNERQLRVINRMLEEGPNGFDGGMSAKKYMAIAKTTKATATRDLQNLTDIKVFYVSGGGRSIHYNLILK